MEPKSPLIQLLEDSMETSFQKFVDSFKDTNPVPPEAIESVRFIYNHAFVSGSVVMNEINSAIKQVNKLNNPQISVN